MLEMSITLLPSGVSILPPLAAQVLVTFYIIWFNIKITPFGTKLIKSVYKVIPLTRKL